jgi:hypothetical protein
MAVKYISIFQCKSSEIYPNLYFWFENKPSGNPAFRQRSDPRWVTFLNVRHITADRTAQSNILLKQMFSHVLASKAASQNKTLFRN